MNKLNYSEGCCAEGCTRCSRCAWGGGLARQGASPDTLALLMRPVFTSHVKLVGITVRQRQVQVQVQVQDHLLATRVGPLPVLVVHDQVLALHQLGVAQDRLQVTGDRDTR